MQQSRLIINTVHILFSSDRAGRLNKNRIQNHSQYILQTHRRVGRTQRGAEAGPGRGGAVWTVLQEA